MFFQDCVECEIFILGMLFLSAVTIDYIFWKKENGVKILKMQNGASDKAYALVGKQVQPRKYRIYRNDVTETLCFSML